MELFSVMERSKCVEGRGRRITSEKKKLTGWREKRSLGVKGGTFARFGLGLD